MMRRVSLISTVAGLAGLVGCSSGPQNNPFGTAGVPASGGAGPRGGVGGAVAGGVSGSGQVVTCPAGMQACSGVCVALGSDNSNCGTCGNVCPPGTSCMSGVCSCPSGQQKCAQGCVDTNTDPQNCGDCARTCATGQNCVNGQCTCTGGLTLCGTSCVNTQEDGRNCGQCGTICPANQVCSQGTCQASCAAGLTQCGQSCVDVNTSVAHCGRCDNPCPAGQACTNGQCGCANGTLCGGQCVDTNTNAQHCGRCDNPCPVGASCTNGSCVCPSGQLQCSNQCVNTATDAQNCGTCGRVCASGVCSNGNCVESGAGGTTAGGTTGAGGAPGGGAPAGGTAGGGAGGTPSGGAPSGGAGSGGTETGGGGSGGGSSGETGGSSGSSGNGPSDIDCSSMGGPTIAAADVISDFERSAPTGDDDEKDPYLVSYQVSGRGPTPWYGYGATTQSVPVLTRDTTQGACTKGGSLKATSPGNTDWGTGFGVNFMPDVRENGDRDIKGEYDASAYTGIGFYMKCDPEVQFVYLKVPDGPNDADIDNPTCDYSTTPTCNQYGIKNVAVTQDWTYYRLYFDELLQDPNPARPWGSENGIDKKRLTAVQMQINTKYDKDGNPNGANGYTCWVDDVHFIKTPPPSAGSTQACGASNAVSGNKFISCVTGQEIRFRGIDRPSLEWDRSGWNITREDLARIKAWGANVVRFPVRQSFWLDQDTGPLYQKIVQRAVKWTLEQGMYAIIDLHLLDSGSLVERPDSNNSSKFWQQVANIYKNDGRVIFELYNEYFNGDTNNWKQDYTTLYNAVRNAGANNLVLMGGMDWAFNLGEIADKIDSSWKNVGYVTHPYAWKAGSENQRRSAYLDFAKTRPVIATEFGDADIDGDVTNNGCRSGDCCSNGKSFLQTVIPEFESNGISWTAWAWHVDPVAGCGFPVLLNSYRPEPNVLGEVVKQALATYAQ